MISVRDDDVLLKSSGHTDPLARFKAVHSTIVNGAAFHVPGILCGEISQFTGAVEFIDDRIKAGEMSPQIHGWKHSEYHKYTERAILEDLHKCVDFFDKSWHLVPTKFFTPWGGDSPELRAACHSMSLELVDCSAIIPPRTVQRNFNHYRGAKNVELFIHWWEGMGRLEDALRILNG